MKKIKTINVEESVYNGLLEMFKKYGGKASLSLFLNNCLVEMFGYLKQVEKLLNKYSENPGFTVPLSFIVSEIEESLTNMKWPEIAFFSDDWAEATDGWEECEQIRFLTLWEDEYQAKKLGITGKMYSYMRSGKFDLDRSKQFLIEKKTGNKWVVVERGRGLGDFIAQLHEKGK